MGRGLSSNETEVGARLTATDEGLGGRRRLDSSIERECTHASRTVLSMADEDYNSCRNLEWQVCAAKGRVVGQRTPRIVFATAPSQVHLDGRHGLPAFGACTGHAPHGCGSVGFANDDIFFMELCAYSKICSNREQLFGLKAGEPFTCEVDPVGIRELQSLLLKANVHGQG